MKHFFTILLCCVATTVVAQVQGYPIAPVPFTAVKTAPASFWGQRIAAARAVTIPLAFSKCQTEGRYRNFEWAAAALQGHPATTKNVSSFMGFSFDDTDVYKTIEGASYVLQTFPNKQLEAYVDSVLDIVAAAQEPDGYLYTARTINPAHPHNWSGPQRWVKEEVLSHELYNLGHMVDAACAHYQATGSRKFLDIACRYADCVCREVGAAKGQATVVPGHQIAEMALARLAQLTGQQRYLDEAKFLLDYRGRTATKNPYSQSHRPVTEQTEAVGHAVRAGYMYAGMADVAAMTGDSAYIKAIDQIWRDIVAKKYYITGGVGARHNGEAYGDAYELPNLTAYNETCAAIAMVYLAQRMFLLHGQAEYIDVLERTLYNGVISGMAIDGGKFFYPNPLECDGHYGFNNGGSMERQPWFGCACCPSNLCRFIPSLPGYMYAVRGRSLYVNLYNSGTATVPVAGRAVTLTQTTAYPYDGDITIRIDRNTAGEVDLALRIPGWVQNRPVPSDLYAYDDQQQPTYTINGAQGTAPAADGYCHIKRKWKKGDIVTIHFDMPARLVRANDKVKDDRGLRAIERGPLVYCAEHPDNAFDITRFVFDRQPKLATHPFDTLQKGMLQITATGATVDYNASGNVQATPATLTLIPYYAWDHRGAGRMRVWNNIIK